MIVVVLNKLRSSIIPAERLPDDGRDRPRQRWSGHQDRHHPRLGLRQQTSIRSGEQVDNGITYRAIISAMVPAPEEPHILPKIIQDELDDIYQSIKASIGWTLAEYRDWLLKDQKLTQFGVGAL